MPGVRRLRTEWLSGGLHLLIIFIAAQADDPGVWPFALAAMSLVSFVAWIGNYRRYRQVEDLPTSKVATAAQGYVELIGQSQNIPDCPVRAPISQLPCCWYRYSIETRDSENKWTVSDSGESVEHFLLVDGTGECVISPDGAEVLYARNRTWISGDQRYTEWLLLPRGTLYAIGEFRTVGGAELALDERKDISDRLAEWKRDQKTLLERFDMNRDGKIDLVEWERARQAARDEVQKEHAETRSTSGINLLRKPADGRLFLLAAADPTKIGRRYAVWAWVHLGFFFAAGGAAFALMARMLR